MVEAARLDAMGLQRKAFKGVLWSAAEGWGRQAISFLVFALLARLLNPDAFGLVALAGVFLAFLQIFVDQGFPTAIIQRSTLEEAHLNTAFWTNLGVSSVLTCFCIVMASDIAQGLKQPELTPVIQWLSLGLLLTALSSVQQSLLRRKFRFKELAIRSLVAIILGGGVGVGLAIAGWGVWSLVGKQLTEGLAAVIVLWWSSDWRPKFQFSRQHFQELISFGGNIVGANIFEFFNRQSDNFLIGLFLGSAALGYYSVAYRVLIILTQLLSVVVNQVALPVFSELQQDITKLRGVFYEATRLTSFIAFPCFLGMAALSPELVEIIFGHQWLPSAPVMSVLALIGIQHAISYLYSDVILAMGKASWRMWLNGFNAISNVVCFAVAVKWGIVAVAWSFVIQSGIIATPMFYLATQRLIHLDFKTYIKQLLSPLLACGVMVGTILIFKLFLKDWLDVYPLTFVLITSGILSYTVVCWLLEPKYFSNILRVLQSRALPKT
ncbi:MAG TPA: lipopolysaccharide biosynthesis protein [Stenomitos sp.]